MFLQGFEIVGVVNPARSVIHALHVSLAWLRRFLELHRYLPRLSGWKPGQEQLGPDVYHGE